MDASISGLGIIYVIRSRFGAGSPNYRHVRIAVPKLRWDKILYCYNTAPTLPIIHTVLASYLTFLSDCNPKLCYFDIITSLVLYKSPPRLYQRDVSLFLPAE